MANRVLLKVAFLFCVAGIPFKAAQAQLPPMDPSANPTFEVATIKPNNSGKPSMQGLTMFGRTFRPSTPPWVT